MKTVYITMNEEDGAEQKGGTGVGGLCVPRVLFPVTMGGLLVLHPVISSHQANENIVQAAFRTS